MKRTVKLAMIAAVMGGVGTCAEAADLSRPIAPAPAPVAYNWTGFYGGVHVGWGWGSNDVTVLSGSAAFPAGFTSSHDFDGAVIGGQIGYNFQLAPNWVMGVEGDGAWLTFEGSDTRSSPVPAFAGIRTSTVQTQANWMASAAGRLGYAADNWLFYAKGGWAWAEFESSGATSNPVNGALLAITHGKNTRNGYLVGGGIEWGFARNWTAKIEYNYIDFGSDTVDHTARVDVLGGTPRSHDIDTTVNIVKVGANYRF